MNILLNRCYLQRHKLHYFSQPQNKCKLIWAVLLEGTYITGYMERVNEDTQYWVWIGLLYVPLILRATVIECLGQLVC
jgi:hypothetical protein